MNLGDRFVVKGSLPFAAVSDLLWTSDIMVHNAMVNPGGGREALGVTLMEAGAVGLPVVSCRVGGIPEVVIDNETGFLVESGDLDAMADKVVLLVKKSDLRCQMGIAAMRHVRKSFDSNLLAAKLENLYDTVRRTGRVKTDKERRHARQTQR